MPQTVDIPGQGTATFPDQMSPDEIKAVIQQKFFPSVPAPIPQDAPLPVGTTTQEKPLQVQASIMPVAVAGVSIPTPSERATAASFEPYVPIPKAGQQPEAPRNAPLLSNENLIPLGRQVGAGLYNTITNIIQPLESPAGVGVAAASVVPGVGRLVGAGFGTEMLSDMPEARKAFGEATTTQGKVEAGGRYLTDAIFGILGLKHAVHVPVPEAAIIKAAEEPLPKDVPDIPVPPEAPIPVPIESLPATETPTTEVQPNASTEQSTTPMGQQPVGETSLGEQGSSGVEPGNQGSEVAGTTPSQVTAEAGAVVPTEPAQTGGTGIAQRVHEARAVEGKLGEIIPGEGVSAEEMITRGRELVSQGVNPDEVATRVNQTKQVGADDIAVLRARMEELSKATNAAEDALRQRPNDLAAKAAYEQAWKAETDWAQNAVKPAQTEWHKAGMAMQGETAIDTGTFTGLRRAFRDEKGREPTPKEQVKIQELSDENQTADAKVEKAKQAYDEVVKKEVGKRTPRGVDELREHFANRLKALLPC